MVFIFLELLVYPRGSLPGSVTKGLVRIKLESSQLQDKTLPYFSLRMNILLIACHPIIITLFGVKIYLFLL